MTLQLQQQTRIHRWASFPLRLLIVTGWDFLFTDCIRHCQRTKAFSANFICQIHSKQRVDWCNNWGLTMSPSYCFSIQSSVTFPYNGVSLFHTVFHCCCISKLCIILGEVQCAEEYTAGFVGILCTMCSSSCVQQIPLNYFDCRIWKLFHLHGMAFFIHHLLHCTCVCAWLIFSLTLCWILCDVLTHHIHHVWWVWFIHNCHVLVDHGYIITIYICTQNWVRFLKRLLGYFIVQ
jgi:hypothetical protein